MKIRLRLTIIFFVMLAISLALCGIILLDAAATISIKSAEQGAQGELSMLNVSYENVLKELTSSSMGEAVQRSIAVYLFRQYISSQSQFSLMRNGEILYNNSDYAIETILQGESNKTIHVDGKWLYLATDEELMLNNTSYQIFITRDVTDVYQGIYTLRLQFIAICLGTFILSAVIIMLCTFRALQPLKTLQKSAAAIANGIYDQRIGIHGRDEIAELGKSFNKMADAVQQNIEKITATAEERKLLLGALTHELKTPMTAIIGYSEYLQKSRLTVAQREEAIDFIHLESQRLERLTQKMMRLITLTDGESVQLSIVPVKQLFTMIERTVLVTAKERGVNVTMDFESVYYNMDVDLIASVIINLFDNACAAGAKNVHINATQAGVTVSDDGCGIPSKALELITQPFYRIDKARSRKHGNAGLGLALVQRIAELHHAGLIIESEENKGTRIIFSFI